MATSPTSGPGGGGGGGGALTPPVTITATGPTVEPLVVEGAASQTAPIFEARSHDGTQGLYVDGDGADGLGLCFLGGPGVSSVLMLATGDVSVTADANLGLGGDIIDIQTPINRFALATAAPADGALTASMFSLWLDATPGVGNTKLMIKAKDSAGTVRQATIVLA